VATPIGTRRGDRRHAAHHRRAAREHSVGDLHVLVQVPEHPEPGVGVEPQHLFHRRADQGPIRQKLLPALPVGQQHRRHLPDHVRGGLVPGDQQAQASGHQHRVRQRLTLGVGAGDELTESLDLNGLRDGVAPNRVLVSNAVLSLLIEAGAECSLPEPVALESEPRGTSPERR